MGRHRIESPSKAELPSKDRHTRILGKGLLKALTTKRPVRHPGSAHECEPKGRHHVGSHPHKPKEATSKRPVNGRHYTTTDPGVPEARYWRGMGEPIKDSAQKEKQLKQMFAQGLDRLVANWAYDSRVKTRIPDAKLTPVWDGRENTDRGLDGSDGYTDEEGRYISVRNLDQKKVVMHELGHRVLRMWRCIAKIDDETGAQVGWKPELNIYIEPAVERLATDVVSIMSIDHTDGDMYRAHDGVFDKTLQLGKMSFKEFTGFASGDDPEMNYELFRSRIWEGAGWDVVGFAQQGYLGCLRDWGDSHENRDLAAQRVDQVLAQYVPAVEPVLVDAYAA